MKRFVFLCCFFQLFQFQAQIRGKVIDPSKEGVFAANVYWAQHANEGVVTDWDGNFEISDSDLDDTLMVSYIGYSLKRLARNEINGQPLIIQLSRSDVALKTVTIEARDPISEDYSVEKMSRLDIYFNPMSQGDPLKAITALPSSTTIDESANPSLRGSSAQRSRVTLNGVPIYQPVRASQLNNQGFFSLFNPEIIDQQYIYASNPPLTYGNSSAGMVEIESVDQIKQKSVQFSTTIASIGAMTSIPLKKERSFIQLYGNYQNSSAFIQLNESNLPRLKGFNTLDAGLNFQVQWSERVRFNSFHYAIQEDYQYFTTTPSYEGNSSFDNRRYFTVNNIEYLFSQGIVTLNQGFNTNQSDYTYGSLDAVKQQYNQYYSLDMKWFLHEKVKLQGGLSYDLTHQELQDSVPLYSYYLSPDATVFFSERTVDNGIQEAYLFGKLKINSKWSVSGAVRKNLPIQNQESYLSYQLSSRFNWKKKHSLLLSGGKYHSYAIVGFFNNEPSLLSSKQLAIDYEYTHKALTVKAAVYGKQEEGERTNQRMANLSEVQTIGVESQVIYQFNKHLKANVSNTWIDQTINSERGNYRGNFDFNYFVRGNIQYQNRKGWSVNLSYITRPGNLETSVINARLNPSIGAYEPIYSEIFNDTRLQAYNRIDLGISKYSTYSWGTLVSFLSVNNLMNKENESNLLYELDYTAYQHDYFQRRAIFIGFVFQFNNLK